MIPLSQVCLWLIHLEKPYPSFVVEKIDKFKQIIRKLTDDELYDPIKVGQYVDIYDNYDVWLLDEAYRSLLEEDETFRTAACRRLCSQWRYTLTPHIDPFMFSHLIILFLCLKNGIRTGMRWK